ncbi:hypothetical protein CC86DRAFT_303591 [Ophiobolus disseminans]|uniref:Zn(2)-C6 fungal-type domain-containing protein n=1 Tax=Ophiobolus disseminans TaxID=1469910 RepID=A0A6A6ZJ56_9PLEO|nr:hypothetical protein CC86DRAFT_303591 [Ophiobolus disseminans]
MSEQRVAKRKTHTKSRRGCLPCKQRHTKCNEARPRCANCIRLDITCTWPEATNGSSPNPSSGEGHASPASHGPAPDLSISNFDLSIPDMRLLHHWTSRGYKALHPSLTNRSDLWRNAMIELGFEHPFLLHGILALSAIHKGSFLLQAQRQDLLQQADLHISLALDPFRRHLETPNDQAAVPMFVLSSVLLTYNFGSVQERPEDSISSLHHCLMLLNGIKVVIGPHWGKIKDSPVLAQMFETSSPDAIQLLNTLSRGEKRHEILRLTELTELMLDTHDKTACAEAIEDLHAVAIRVRHVRIDRDEYPIILYWAVSLTSRFYELLVAHNPVACIITVHFIALIAQCRPVWWLEKWPRWLLAHTEQLLGATPDLLEWLHWPREVIGSASAQVIATPTPMSSWSPPVASLVQTPRNEANMSSPG